jgi:SAM-dependent methyltransferase
MDFDQQVFQEVRRVVNEPNANANAVNTHLLTLMLWYRARLIEGRLLQDMGATDVATVLSGPFQGLKLRLPIQTGGALPMIAGLYESELHPFIERAVARGYGHVVNIGCGDGYYTCGMARRMPRSWVFGFDINPRAREGAIQTAALNGVAARVTIGGLFNGEDFARFPAHDTLVICDIEGGEDALLNPEVFPALKGHDIVVEAHEVYCPGIGERLRARFSPTHDVLFIDHQRKRANIPQLGNLNEIDEFLLSSEGRGGPTPWFVMTVKKP